MWPGTGLAYASTRVTVIVEAALPSATTEAGHATTVEPAALGAPGVKVTVVVWVRVRVSVVSVAV